jgi:hypothetical protein
MKNHMLLWSFMWICLLSFPQDTHAQGVDVQLEIGGGFQRNKKIREDFPAGLQLGLGAKIPLPYEQLYWTAHVDLLWHFQPLDEVYTEHVVHPRLSAGLEYDVYQYGSYRLAPFFKVGPTYLTNYDREGGVVGDEETAPIGARYLRGWGWAQETGVKVYIGDHAFVKLHYTHSQPTLKVLQHELLGKLGHNTQNRAKITKDMSFWGFTLGLQIPRN